MSRRPHAVSSKVCSHSYWRNINHNQRQYEITNTDNNTSNTTQPSTTKAYNYYKTRDTVPVPIPYKLSKDCLFELLQEARALSFAQRLSILYMVSTYKNVITHVDSRYPELAPLMAWQTKYQAELAWLKNDIQRQHHQLFSVRQRYQNNHQLN